MTLWRIANQQPETCDIVDDVGLIARFFGGEATPTAIMTVEQHNAQLRAPDRRPVRVYCTVCNRPKPPRGRSVSAASASGYCGYGCLGYPLPPDPGTLWPEEWDDMQKEIDRPV